MSAGAGALAYVERCVARSSAEADLRIARVLSRHAQPAHLAHLARTLVDALAASARVTLSFHPDRLGRDGATVAEGLLRDGLYRSQFQTGVRIALRRHGGFVLGPAEVPSDFRGPRMPRLAERISGGSDLDAVTLGRAAQSLVREPATWSDWGSAAETWQHIKQLWHVLVRFGRERSALDTPK